MVEEFLDQCVQSLVSQSYSDVEIILVDDGSSDKCGEMCEAWAEKDSRIKVIHKCNGGLSDARNAGVLLATGDYICFVDGDDYVSPEYCAMLLKAALDSGCEIAECGTAVHPSDLSFTFQVEKYELLTAYQWLTETGLGDFFSITVWNKIYRRTLFDEVEFPVGKVHEDELITPILVYEAGKVARIRERLYYYRQREGSIIHSVNKHNDEDGFFLQKNKIEFFVIHNEPKIANFANAKLCIWLIDKYKVYKSERKDIYNEVKKRFKTFHFSSGVPLKYKLYIFAFLSVRALIP